VNQKLKHRLFAAIPSVVALVIAGLFVYGRSRPLGGVDLNQRAWEASYLERNKPIPPQGPREGFWGSRIRRKARDELLGWREPPVVVPGLLEIDEDGVQHRTSGAADPHQIMILGGSVAFGAYSSAIDTTYFHLLGKELERALTAANLHIVAGGAWKSEQELKAFGRLGPEFRPDLTIFLNGLNDIVNGSTSRLRYGQVVPTLDGRRWSVTYHVHDYDQRVRDYLDNMAEAARLATSLGSDLLIVLQPSLLERAQPTATERDLMRAALLPHPSAEALTSSYEALRRGLTKLAQSPGVHFLDASRCLQDERATTFADLWHFSDFGHEILAKEMARRVIPILEARRARRSGVVETTPTAHR